MSWEPPKIGSRTVAVLGAGVLGRRIACVWVAGGYNVTIRDPDADQRNAAIDFIDNNILTFAKELKGTSNLRPGNYSAYEDLHSAVKNSWLAIEAVPEKLDLKISIFTELALKAPEDCILGSNSSSYKSSLMVEKLDQQAKERVLNIHYTMPPLPVVELMTSTFTHAEIFSFLEDKHRAVRCLPGTARVESTGFILNRLWAAMKRETMMILAEGVTTPAEIDSLFVATFGAKIGPCAAMDAIGLDTVALIEDNYIKERHLDATNTVNWLRKNYVDKGLIGAKSGNSGLYPAVYTTKSSTDDNVSHLGHLAAPTLYILDIGLGENVTSNFLSSGKIYAASNNGENVRLLVDGLALPDGIDISVAHGRIFWTNMGVPAENNGSVQSVNLDGSGIKTIVPQGMAHTPKQLCIDHTNERIYFSDREGMRVHRVNFDGSQHEILVKTGDFDNHGDKADQTRHCVGIAVDPKHGKFYWTQKGPSKAGQGRIFRANIEMPVGEDASTRPDIELLFENLPEPIDLEIDPDSEILYWTDRGEYPAGNSVNRGYVNKISGEFEVVIRHLHEAIGIRLDKVNKHIYFVDLGGSVYRCDLDGQNKMVIYSGKAALAGLALTHHN